MPSRSERAKAKSKAMISFQTMIRTAVGRISYSLKRFSTNSFETADFIRSVFSQKNLNFRRLGENMEILSFLKKNCYFISIFLPTFAAQNPKKDFVSYLLVLCFSCVLFKIQRAGRFAVLIFLEVYKGSEKEVKGE